MRISLSEERQILIRVYLGSLAPLSGIMLFICLVLGYDWRLICAELSTCLVLALPAVLSLQLCLLVLRLIGLARPAAWILLFGTVPLLALIPAFLFARSVPGDVWVLEVLGLITAYAGILAQGMPIASLFTLPGYGTE